MGALAVLLALGATVTVGTFIGWFIHWAMHERWSGKLHRAHMTHHLKLYPHSDLLSDTYRDAGADNGLLVFTPGIALVVGVFGIVLFCFGVPVIGLIAAVILSILVGAANDLLHTSFHLRGSRLQRFGWFRTLRSLHFYHHRNMKKNLGIIWFGWDRLFKTFRSPVTPQDPPQGPAA